MQVSVLNISNKFASFDENDNSFAEYVFFDEIY